MNYLFGLIIVVLVIDSQSQKLLADSTKYTDPSKSDAESILSVLAPGLLESGLHSLEPLEIHSLSLDKDHLLYTVRINYTDVKVYGLTKNSEIHIERIRIDDGRRVLYMNASNDRITFLSDYVMNGDFLKAPFSGDGRANVTLLDVKIEIIVHWKDYEIDNVQFSNVTQCGVKLVPGQVLFDFTNFVGCRDYADSEKNAFMNSNWEMFFGQNKGPLEEELGSVFMEFVNELITHISKDDLSNH